MRYSSHLYVRIISELITVLDLPYQPPFDSELPNYKNVGKTLFKLAHSYPYDDSPAAEIAMDEEAVKVTTWDLLALPEPGQWLD